MKIKERKTCRICGGSSFYSVLNLGEIPLTSVFPAASEPHPESAPLELVKCSEESGGCGLVQLRHTVDPGALYQNSSYGYRSGINATMRDHLRAIVSEVETRIPLLEGDTVIDIGSNDGTLLGNYPSTLTRVGIDPTSKQFSELYRPGIKRIEEFFSREAVESAGLAPAKVITSISMFYDLDDPNRFVADIAASLAHDGVWVLEQSYMPTMLQMNSFDTICHEHLEYYRLAELVHLFGKHGLRVVDVSFNAINGGSFRLAASHQNSRVRVNTRAVDDVLRREALLGLDTPAPYREFAERVGRLRDRLTEVIRDERREGRTMFAYGASTKGNVILDYCGLTADDVAAAADRNPEKVGRRTPGAGIPIISEAEARERRPDAFLILPWSFLPEFRKRESSYLENGGRLLVPLPEVSWITGLEEPATRS